MCVHFIHFQMVSSFSITLDLQDVCEDGTESPYAPHSGSLGAVLSRHPSKCSVIEAQTPASIPRRHPLQTLLGPHQVLFHSCVGSGLPSRAGPCLQPGLSSPWDLVSPGEGHRPGRGSGARTGPCRCLRLETRLSRCVRILSLGLRPVPRPLLSASGVDRVQSVGSCD